MAEEKFVMKRTAEKVFVFVNLSIDSGYYGVNHGIAYLAPLVRKHAHDVHVLQITDEISSEHFRDQIKRLRPSILGYSCTSPQLTYLKKYSKTIEGLPYIVQIAGGVGPTLDPEDFLIQSSIDGVVIGEGEIPIARLLGSISEGKDIIATEGLFWKRNGKIIKNEIPQFIEDLSQLDFPDYTIFEKDVVQIVSGINVILSRGCPYNCNYCSNKAIKASYPSSKHYFRIPTVEYSINLLEHQINQYPNTNYINFEDDLLIANKQWFLSFASEYRKRIGIPYRANVRTECIDKSICKALKESGCEAAFLGLESGNEELRKKVLNRHHTNKEIIEKSKIIKKAGIKLFTFNMMGLPFETKQQMQDTITLNKKIETDFGACTFFYPFPNTELYNICKNEGLLKDDKLAGGPRHYNARPMIRMSPKAERQCIKERKRLLQYFAWRELKYEHQKFSRKNATGLTILNAVRLFAVYFLKRFSSPFEQGSLNRRIMDNKYRIKLWKKIRIILK